MRRSSRKVFHSASTSFEKPQIFQDSFSDEAVLVRPEERFCEKALEDLYYKSLITLSLGKDFSERTEINKTDVDRFALLYGTDKQNVVVNTYHGIIPIRKKGFAWESKQSSSLRRIYRENADRMFERLELCDFTPGHFDSGTIELVDVPYRTTDYLEFSSAAGLVDKKPYKRKGQNSGDAVYLRDFYLNGRRGVFFAVFDASNDKKISDNKTASFLLSLFKKFFKSNNFASNENSVFSSFSSFLNYVNKTFVTPHRISISIGLVYDDQIYYLSTGDCRIYLISLSPRTRVKKLTTDDGIAGRIEQGSRVNKEEFFSKLDSPNSTIYPEIGKTTLDNVDFILASTDGFWSNLPITIKGNYVDDASGEKTLKELLSNYTFKNPRQILEGLYDYSKANMKLRREVFHNDLLIRPNPQDIGLLGFSV